MSEQNIINQIKKELAMIDNPEHKRNEQILGKPIKVDPEREITGYEKVTNVHEMAINELKDVVDKLKVRIAPVLLPKVSPEDNPDKRIEEQLSSLEMYLKVNTSRINVITQDIRDMVDYCCM